MTERRREQCSQSDEGKHSAATTEGGCNEATTGQGTANAKADAEEGEASDMVGWDHSLGGQGTGNAKADVEEGETRDRSRLGRVGP